MNKRIIKKDIKILILIIASLVILDYINLPTLLGFKMSNINWDFCMGILNIILVIVLYMITYKALDQRTIEREKNKKDISFLLIKECYFECLKWVDLLNQDIVEKFIVPKMDSNSTDNAVIVNLKNSPFLNENIIMDLVKDGQVTKKQIEGYFKIKEKYSQYVNMRVIVYDDLNYYEPLKADLYDAIKTEIRTLDKINI